MRFRVFCYQDMRRLPLCSNGWQVNDVVVQKFGITDKTRDQYVDEFDFQVRTGNKSLEASLVDLSLPVSDYSRVNKDQAIFSMIIVQEGFCDTVIGRGMKILI